MSPLRGASGGTGQVFLLRAFRQAPQKRTPSQDTEPHGSRGADDLLLLPAFRYRRGDKRRFGGRPGEIRRLPGARAASERTKAILIWGTVVTLLTYLSYGLMCGVFEKAF